MIITVKLLTTFNFSPSVLPTHIMIDGKNFKNYFQIKTNGFLCYAVHDLEHLP